MRLALAALVLVSHLSAQQASITGYWEGTLSTPNGNLRLGLHISKSSGNKLSGKVDSIDQSAYGLPAEDLVLEDRKLRFTMKVVGASFQGHLNDTVTEISGTFTQGKDVPLVFKKTEERAPTKHPQVPSKPYPYKEEEVTFENKAAAGVTLAGTLTIPEGAGPFPAVILVTGSGPQDRDESLLGHKPFLVLSDYLTRRGIAVLRYDDRGVGKSTGKFAEATTQDFAGDASAAVDFLKVREEIDAKRIGIVGHSEGGVVAPMVAARRDDLRFIVLMAGTGVPGDQVILEQGKAVLKLQGATEDAIAQQRKQQSAIFQAAKEGKTQEEAKERLRKVLGDSEQSDAQAANLSAPWFRFFLAYDPAPTLTKVTIPVLVVQGELDKQVLPDQNLPPIEAALKQGGNRDYRVLRLPKLNHLFQTATSGAPSEYAQIEETMSPVALEKISEWIRAHTGLPQ